MSLFAKEEEYERRAINKVGNSVSGGLAFLRPRMLRVLGLLAESNSKEAVGNEAVRFIGYLTAEKDLVKLQRRRIRSLYPAFDPVKHYAKITLNKKGEEIEYVPVAEYDVPYELRYVRSLWDTTVVYEDFLNAWLKKFEINADSVYSLTGTALVQKMMDYSGRTNYALDSRTADEISQEVYAEEEPEESEPATEVTDK